MESGTQLGEERDGIPQNTKWGGHTFTEAWARSLYSTVIYRTLPNHMCCCALSIVVLVDGVSNVTFIAFEQYIYRNVISTVQKLFMSYCRWLLLKSDRLKISFKMIAALSTFFVINPVSKPSKINANGTHPLVFALTRDLTLFRVAWSRDAPKSEGGERERWRGWHHPLHFFLLLTIHS